MAVRGLPGGGSSGYHPQMTPEERYNAQSSNRSSSRKSTSQNVSNSTKSKNTSNTRTQSSRPTQERAIERNLPRQQESPTTNRSDYSSSSARQRRKEEAMERRLAREQESVYVSKPTPTAPPKQTVVTPPPPKPPVRTDGWDTKPNIPSVTYEKPKPNPTPVTKEQAIKDRLPQAQEDVYVSTPPATVTPSKPTVTTPPKPNIASQEKMAEICLPKEPEPPTVVENEDTTSSINAYNGKKITVTRANGSVAFSSTINLSDNEFNAIDEMCKATGVEAKMVLSIMAHESNFKSNAYNNSSGASGYMQVLKKYYSSNLTANKNLLEIAKKYSSLSEIALIENPLNPYGNIAAGINALVNFKKQYGEEDMLKAYASGNIPSSGWSEWSQDMDWEFRNIMSQL